MTGLVILAAGESKRLGRPKQTLLHSGKTLLAHAADTAINSACRPVIIVLGAYGAEIELQIKQRPVIIHHNPQWREGMASSIRSGIQMLQQAEPGVSAVILMVCDQPYVNTELLTALINKKAVTEKHIIASSYNDTAGVPVLFDKKLFPELLLLKGREGAKKLLLKHKNSLDSVPFPPAGIDIDTIKDYEALTS